MLSKVLLLLACCLAVVLASPVDLDIENQQLDTLHSEFAPLRRQVRSPDGHVDLTYSKDQFGRQAGVEYGQNIYRSDNGRFNVDAYAQASRNFDYNRNNFGGGIRGSWRF
ncbi:uncharacterized protein LOC119672191 [Teleopsis dalmanni]|uniref:uncharacterized protein LOC119670429 n=1 Tax=Teleopsis dalmanni TaxID=139649 RepID=UPI0018CEDAD9|nr:uncharacterized protein LOC119670429 [Teleopsis dalmanni]XP_037939111.1 uncharacterized protein LOC119672191 [Teleopsis dalmanni]